MPLNEFWNEEPNLFWAYRFYFYQRLKRQNEYDNEKAWLQGAYICEAVSVALNNAFSKKHLDYPKEPYDLYHDKTKEEAKAKQIKMEEIIKARAKKIEGLLGGNKKDE